MRIALAIRSLELGGGAEHDVVNLSTGLMKAGHPPLVITAGGRLCEDLRAAGVPVALCPLATRRPGQAMRNARRLADILREHQVDVLNPQSVMPAVSGRLATRMLRKAGLLVPNVVTIHMLQRLTWWYYRMGAFLINRCADHVIVESDCELGRLRRGGMNRQATVLYNCVPPAHADTDAGADGGDDARARRRQETRRQLGWAQDKVVLLMPARMTFEKAHDVVLTALARAELSGANLLVFLAGDGPLLEQHRAAAGAMGLTERVVFGGFRRDLPALYRAADVLLLPSKWESLPLSIREAMGAGLPVVATAIGGIAEAVEDGASGLLIPPDDPRALADAIARLAGDAGLRSRMGQRGREICREKFDYDRWIARTVEVMQAVRAGLTQAPK
jgi:glycosyltransferase involved in cell wall biosynthesis